VVEHLQPVVITRIYWSQTFARREVSSVANPSLVLPGGGSLSKTQQGNIPLWPLTSLVPRLLPSFAYAYYTKKGRYLGTELYG